ncbi:MAG: hypothetical protein LC737_08000, partial [Chloroflexi bacterium]|nr:hypothetical protein [Chloroflexota bacterium]
RQVAILDVQLHVGFVFSNIICVNDEGQPIGGLWNRSLPPTDTIFAGQKFFRRLLSDGNFVPCQTVMARAECYKEWGVFDARLGYTPDLEMWLRLSLHTDVAYLAEPLVRIRRHADQESRHYMGKVQEVNEVWRALQVIFTEQRTYVSEPEFVYRLAMRHLCTWVKMFLRTTLKHGQLSRALVWGQIFLYLLYTQKRGLSSLIHSVSGNKSP